MGFRYYSPLTQVIIVGFVCFLCPGMFNALNGLGGGGQLDHKASNNANTALYSTFVLFGVLGGGIVNLLGVRWTIFGSGFTYAFYSASYIYLNHKNSGALTIAAGALLGVGAGILWAAQGMIMVSYPKEDQKASYVAIFWVIFNLGGVVGALITFGINFHSNAGSLSDAVYIVFVVLECIGAFLGLILAPPSKVVRDDGTSVVLVKYTNVFKEIVEIAKLFINPTMLALLPMSFYSNFFTPYQFDQINLANFDLSTRGFNNIFYWAAQMLGAYLISLVLDSTRFTRKKRGLISLAIVTVISNAIWGGSLGVLNKYPKGLKLSEALSYKNSSKSGGIIFLYVVCGAADAVYQSLAYWVIGALTNNNQLLARYVGFYKGMQSLGGAISWQLGAKEVSTKNQLVANWIIFALSLPPMLYVIYNLKDHSEDAKMADELEFEPNEKAAEEKA